MHPYDQKKAFELAERLARRLRRDLFCAMAPLKSEFALAGRQTPFDERLSLTYRPIAPGEVWGRTWQTGWFHFTGKLPRRPEQECVPVVRINTGGEALLFDASGKALTGLTAFCWFADDFVREEYFPPKPPRALDYWCAATANKLAGLDVDYDPALAAEANGSFEARFTLAEAGWMRTAVKALILDLKCLLSLAETLPDGDYRRRAFARAFSAADAAYADNPDNAQAARACLAPLLARPANADALTVTAVGHSHLDTAYMWPVRETVQKAARTFATQLALLDACPDYVFGASTPLHYQMVKEHYPELYARIRQAVAAKRWEPQGGMWVEADLNVPDGESLVRQFLHGKNFFRDEFGVEVRNVWLPDDFGYGASLPQIMKLARCESFVSIKIAVGEWDKFPCHTFRWRGIDGTEVLAHLPPEGFYSSWLQPKTLCKAQNDYAESAETGEFLSLFGLGDGGAGATRDEIEAGRRLANLEDAPKVRFGAAQPLLDRLRRHWDALPVWDGEIYLERHRGITSSLARFKRGNRKREQLLAATEFLCSAVLGGKDYPAEQFDQAWKLLLLHQFHDILSGTSIDETYQEVERDYARIDALCAEARALAEARLRKRAGALLLVNTLNMVWRGWVTLPAEWGGMSTQDALATRRNADGSVEAYVELAPLSDLTLRRGARKAPAAKAVATRRPILENDRMRYEFDADLHLVSAYDKRERLELIREGQFGNDLRLYRDYPDDYEAWDIDRHYRDCLVARPSNPSGSVAQEGDRLTATLTVGSSVIRQQVLLDRESPLLTFRTELEWHEKRRMLRVVFPTTLSSDFATYDVQFGTLRRPTHENTSWDQARFEVMHHKYMDLSGNWGGVALLNDCKYGGRVFGQDLELTLQRSPRFPSLHTEEGRQEFQYAFYPHPGTCALANVAAVAECFNRPPLALPGRDAMPPRTFTVGPEVALAAFKRAEKGTDLIIRLVERQGMQAEVEVNAARGYRLAECDLLEWEARPVQAKRLSLAFHPFEIKTLRIRRQPS